MHVVYPKKDRMLTLQLLTIQRNNTVILSIDTCTINKGTTNVFIGNSGIGKTTLLKSIAQLVPYNGLILVNNQKIDDLNVHARTALIGYVFQEFNLFPHLTVLHNVMEPLLIRGIDKQEAERRAQDLLDQLALATLYAKYPYELSGGQQQRVAIARTLVLRPQLLLLDEPTANVDPAMSAQLMAILKTLAQELGITICIATHDVQVIKKADVIYLLEQGKISASCDTRALTAMPENIVQFLNV